MVSFTVFIDDLADDVMETGGGLDHGGMLIMGEGGRELVVIENARCGDHIFWFVGCEGAGGAVSEEMRVYGRAKGGLGAALAAVIKGLA